MTMTRRQTVYLLAGQADVEARTADRWLRGGRVHAATQRVLTEAAHRLGIVLPAEGPRAA